MASNNRLTSINTSTSKQFYSFSKTTRFPVKSPLNSNVAYDHKTGFSDQKTGGKGFSGTSTRFDYYGSPERERKKPTPSPLNYTIKGTFGANGK
jgi:hypothetical protein